jgi:hypothetical protein
MVITISAPSAYPQLIASPILRDMPNFEKYFKNKITLPVAPGYYNAIAIILIV